MSAIVSQKPLRQVQQVKELLVNKQARDQLAAVAAKHMNPERMMRVVANAIRTTPKLQQCEPMSFLGALMHCASLGLEPNTPLGHAYLIPFENKRKGITEVQVVIGYKGFIDLARRSGQLAQIHGDVVYSDDKLWSHEYGSNQHLRHIPGSKKGQLEGAYCYVKLNLGDGITAEGHRFMTLDEIITHRNTHSQGWKTAVRFGKQKDSPWFEGNPAFEAMAIKTAVRALANRGELPMSIEFMSAMQTDEVHADFGAFAMNPTEGLDSTDGDYIEGKAEDEGEAQTDEPERSARSTQNADQSERSARQAEDKPKPKDTKPPAEQERQKPAQEAKPAAGNHDDRQQRTGRAAPAQQQGGQLPLGDAGDSSLSEEDHDRYSTLAGMIIDELATANVDEVMEVYGPQIELLRSELALKEFGDLVDRAIEAATDRDA